MAFRDLGVGVAGILLGVLFIVFSRDLPLLVSKGSPGPSFFPTIVSLISISCGVFLIAKHLRVVAKPSMKLESDSTSSSIATIMRNSSFRNVLKFVAATIMYIYLIPYVGFIFTSFLYMLIVQVIYGVSIARALAVSAATVAFVHITFISVLRVVVPEPILGSIIMR